MFGWLRRSGRAKSAPAPSALLGSTARAASDAGVPAGAGDPRALAGVYVRRFAGMAADKDVLIRVLADPPTWSNTIPLAGPPDRTAILSSGDASASMPASAPSSDPRPASSAQPTPPVPTASVARHAEPEFAPDSSYIASRVLGPRLAHGGPPWDTTQPR